MPKPKLISGIQPTGPLHLGNYLGALKNFVALQNSEKYDCYFFIADYHSLTIGFDPRQKTKQILDLVNTYIASGIDPKKSVIFAQSQTPACTELAWILNTITPIGELERMTQFKDKAREQETNINAGLFTYPALMASDILLYDAKFVPVGDDQLQHLELTRTLARKFNNKFGKVFTEPQPLLTKNPRVMSLDNPAKKMSKSLPSGCLFLNDSPAAIEQKIKRAVTDSGNEIKYDPQNKAGISNLLNIYSALSDNSISNIEEKCINKGYGEFKTALAKIIIKSLEPFRKPPTSNLQLQTILSSGAKKANKISSAKLKQIKKKLGLSF
ncbi:MAG: tryptophanyl-tRNA synthetase [Parcubacteria group bacterium Athens1014_26]|nr:MAG: tryptophanyl-tRNA synthetase [Parcubacteria group bacterium Athens1014_26]